MSGIKEISFKNTNINNGFWKNLLDINAQEAIFHQWDQLEKNYCFNNFKIIAEQKDDFREGYFFADSDAYKWLDAASRIYYNYPSEKLLGKINEFIELIEKTQMEDGYIYTYNQVHFPTKRWINLQIEHELYCAGHLIEAGISHFKATGQEKLLRIVEKVANLIIKDFINSDPKGTPGHQEIELALIKLFRVTDNKEYLEMAKLFVERRGKINHHGSHMFKTIRSVGKRTINISKFKKKYIEEHPEHAQFKIQESSRLTHISPIISFWFILRFINSWRSGKYSQQHKPIREQKVPVGHSVRFSYLETAIAMLYRETFDSSFLKHLEEIWVHMVKKKMYVTGGIGSVPAIEGFGRDYDLHPEHAYCETCAALGSILWNWEMVLITKEAKYSDLLEWQLYNAALVGVSLDGKSYLYHNPLTEKHGLMREVWFDCPCCPSNVSRIYASIGKYIYSHTENEIWIHQYIDNLTVINVDNPIEIEMKSEFPWNGAILIKINSEKSSNFTINLRIPGWVDDYSIKVNGSLQIQNMPAVIKTMDEDRTASGYSPFKSHFIRLTREWTNGDNIELEFPMKIKMLESHPKVKSNKNKIVLTRGPLVYCVENIDNLSIDIFEINVNPSTLEAEFKKDLLNGIWIIKGKTKEGNDFVSIPYYSWANRKKSNMTVLIGK